MAPTSATYFYMTDQRGTDRTRPAEPPYGASTSSTASPYRYLVIR